MDGFPAEQITNRENFVSLLYYFGLLSIDRVEEGDTILRIPNLAVREQMYTYLTEGFSRTGVFRLEFWRLGELAKAMAFRGVWRPVFEFLASEVDKQTTIREYIEGEALVKGFMQPYLGCSNYFIMRPEYELNKGYADFYLQPNLLQLPDVKYSYLIEVKYYKRGETDAAVEAKVAEAADQLRHYSGDPLVEATQGNTILRRILIVWRGWKIVRMEEVEG